MEEIIKQYNIDDYFLDFIEDGTCKKVNGKLYAVYKFKNEKSFDKVLNRLSHDHISFEFEATKTLGYMSIQIIDPSITSLICELFSDIIPYKLKDKTNCIYYRNVKGTVCLRYNRKDGEMFVRNSLYYIVNNLVGKTFSGRNPITSLILTSYFINHMKMKVETADQIPDYHLDSLGKLNEII